MSLELQRKGYIVIEAFKRSDNTKVRNGFLAALRAMPEFIDPNDMIKNNRPFVMGGFSALGNPSSFHNILVRNIREWCHVIVLQKLFLEALKLDSKLKFEQDIDRMMYRPKGQSPTKEAWHRDESLNAIENDTIYGGWINLDDTPQYFSCVPGSHKEVGNRNGGFAKIDKEDRPKYKARKEKVEIPAGHIIIFYERIVHEVTGGKAKHPMCRLFLGWRLTYGSKSLVGDNLNKYLEQMQPVPIKSGQTPPMYAKLHWVNWRNKLLDFTKDISPQFTEMKTLKKTGERFRVVQKEMDGLVKHSILTNLCPPYKHKEYKMLAPQRKWTLLKPGSQREYITIDADAGGSGSQKKPSSNVVIDLTLTSSEEESSDSDDSSDDETKKSRRKSSKKMEKRVSEIFDDDESSDEDEILLEPQILYKDEDIEAETLYDKDGNKQKFRFTNASLLLMGEYPNEYMINRYSASEIHDANIVEVIQYMILTPRYRPLFIELTTWNDMPERDQNKLKLEIHNHNLRIIVLHPLDEINIKPAAAPTTTTTTTTTTTIDNVVEDFSKRNDITIDEILQEFVHLYAPWTTLNKGLIRVGKTHRKRAQTVIYSKNNTEGRRLSKDKGYHVWYTWSDYRTFTSRWVQDPDVSHEANTAKARAQREGWMNHTRTTPLYTGRSAKTDDDIEGPLKLYVWYKRNEGRMIITGSCASAEMIFPHLPYAFSGSEHNWTAAKKYKKSKRTVSYSYKDNVINANEMYRLQDCINQINEKYKYLNVSTDAPYKSGRTPDPLTQILGWHIKADFPEEVTKYFNKNKVFYNTLDLGANGPVRTRGTTESPWKYRFGLSGTTTSVVMDIVREIGVEILPNFYPYYIRIHWQDKKVMDQDTKERLEAFADMKQYNVTLIGWSTFAGKGGHCRLMVKAYDKDGIRRYFILDPWMQGTRKHKDGFDAIEYFIRRRKYGYVRKLDIPAEQADGEGSCVAISLSRALNIAFINKGNSVLSQKQKINLGGLTPNGEWEKTIPGVKEDILPWIPVVVKILMNRYRGTAAETRANRGGRRYQYLIKL